MIRGLGLLQAPEGVEVLCNKGEEENHKGVFHLSKQKKPRSKGEKISNVRLELSVQNHFRND